MTEPSTSTFQWSGLFGDPWALAQAAGVYGVDAWQRTILYADIERQVGDQYREKLRDGSPGVLSFPSEPVMSGADLPRPTNYQLVRILAQGEQKTDETRRPFVVIDPRAGHGPGIGGFKPDSEIGAALKAGHPCYFVGFLPDPVPGQTIEDVMRTFAAFVQHVGERHPESGGKPAVIGNCQAGWQLLMTAAVWPDLFGPLLVAGAPLSYWAGDNPMRYAGGLLGGSWLTALTSDIGAGRFDGAWLVQNFENLDPANTLWSKQYNVYAKADTEAERYIGFEKYWGGYVYLNDVEMQFIVDNLFIGNKLSTAQLMTSDGLRIDLRNIRSPIIVFCSYGDNITPPPQALGWITDLYKDDEDVFGHDQTIVYTTHDSIGHLGIFVSSSVGQKEHRKFASMIDQIDLFPAGIYRATVDATPENTPDFADPYLMSIRRSNIEEVRDIVRPDLEAERCFAAAARVSEINLALYRNTLQPWLRALSTSYSARWLQALHPLRMSFELWSSEHPLAQAVSELAEQVRQDRQPVTSDNPFLLFQKDISAAMEHFLDSYRDHRDQIYAMWFGSLYGSPGIKALAGQALGDDLPARPHPGDTPEHRDMVRKAVARLDALSDEGGLIEAAVRALFYVIHHQGGIDERHYHRAFRLWDKDGITASDAASFRRLVREQAVLLAYKGDAAIDALPAMLEGADAGLVDRAANFISELAHAGGDVLSEEGAAALSRVTEMFAKAAEQSREIASVLSEADAPPQGSARAPVASNKPEASRRQPRGRPRKT
ncbi:MULTISPECIES: DUF3141 domain-containing protein [Brucella/Ochrobactrum group]|uniref:DUF3141 domain-containing protein n=1 Tax=Brucella/Ochrobactrum group TaxID=2826938 RepID=UPI00124D9896|nr:MULTISPECIES: DUF3141 domain-containing protein [Brucella/Ochrobactrum group]KAB2758346.1 DUF3141 domain-containing protein [Brucella anthropi]MCQ9147180.1 DUF3141 domain-containing protein [Ochrobactrum sp. BTU2]